ncbi:uncharacterized protein DUF1788 [Orenia metallireducens]|jgi:hypothetical protein|uniref:DUF1788 domain-containing protein n=1 Tax=Orenia metallireducens TaxID=1413210 RepID=A0A285HWC9_9FIRM|nr:DUF1788 domain-containing protein [Orenia metallireducens]PRX24090.1 uncharacterized protein DUF1788 [Orenia metallireducens]SNY39021.1 protein of unknown function [Orenia metallireducens]
MSNIRERLDQILRKIKEDSFIEGRGLGNEIGYYVFDYEPKDELLVREHIKFVKDKINNSNLKIKIIEFDLYQIMLNILKDKGYLEKTIKMEKRGGSDRVLKGTKRTLRLLDDNNLLVKYITERVKGNHIVFLTGIGKAWPIIRSHTVLNNLHAALDEVPVVMFFPGVYDGATLKLFGEFKDDNYYRAFRLVEK